MDDLTKGRSHRQLLEVSLSNRVKGDNVAETKEESIYLSNHNTKTLF